MAIYNMVGGGSASFSATINVTNATANATVTATSGSDVFTAIATSSGTATIYVDKKGSYTLTCSGKYSPSAVSVTVNGAIYSVRMLSVPSAYQEVEYLQSSGTQYINTGYSSSYKNAGFEIDFMPLMSATVSTGQNMLGIRGDYYLSLQAYVGDSATKAGYTIITWATWGDINSTYNGLGLTQNVRSTIKYLNDTGVYTNPSGTTTTFSSRCTSTNTENFGLFSCIASGASFNPASLRVYSFKLYDESVLVRNMIPCYRVSDSVAGMYDILNDVFYDNDGTGTFVVGGDVA